jgi:hypothetical protein
MLAIHSNYNRFVEASVDSLRVVDDGKSVWNGNISIFSLFNIFNY